MVEPRAGSCPSFWWWCGASRKALDAYLWTSFTFEYSFFSPYFLNFSKCHNHPPACSGQKPRNHPSLILSLTSNIHSIRKIYPFYLLNITQIYSSLSASSTITLVQQCHILPEPSRTSWVPLLPCLPPRRPLSAQQSDGLFIKVNQIGVLPRWSPRGCLLLSLGPLLILTPPQRDFLSCPVPSPPELSISSLLFYFLYEKFTGIINLLVYCLSVPHH